jgi:CHAT domain-containing protein
MPRPWRSAARSSASSIPTRSAPALNSTFNLAALGKASEAAKLLRQLQLRLLDWLGAELYASQDVARHGSIIASQASFQHLALSLAVAFPAEPATQSLAALAMLRFKGLLAEEEAYLAYLGRGSEDPKVKQAANALKTKRQELAAAYHGGGAANRIETLLRETNEAEVALGRVSRVYREQLRVTRASLEDLQAWLGSGNVLVEFCRYPRADFGKGFQEERWGAVVVGFEGVKVVDLGEVGDSAALVATVMHETAGADAAARTLHARLIEPLKLPPSARLYLAPDDVLHLLPFPRLLDAQGKRLAEQLDLRLVQTSRDLLRPSETAPAKGLLALGGIDFGETPTQLAELQPSVFVARGSAADLRAATVESFRQGFAPLKHSGPEVTTIGQLYRQARPAEPAEVWTASAASEARLKRLTRPPRVLHLATHGFYRPARDPADRPMLLAGITLAGANLALGEDSQDGILYAIEAQDLNLEGTELVVLSACETAQGVIQSGDGVYGLVRALRTAGARYVLVTLRPIGDASASLFMESFYRNLLSQTPGRSDPAAALRDTQRDLINNQSDLDWSPYVLIGG